MSMVKKIVETLDGEIAVHSQVDQGTEVAVRFPLKPAVKGTELDQTPNLDSKSPPNPVSVLRTQCPDKSVAFYGFDGISTSLVKDSIRHYITDWYHFSIVRDHRVADFVIVDEQTLHGFLKVSMNDPPSRVIVLGHPTSITTKAKDQHIHNVLKPVGPYGLAKALLKSWTEDPVPIEAFKDTSSEQKQDQYAEDCLEFRPTELAMSQLNDNLKRAAITVDSISEETLIKTPEAPQIAIAKATLSNAEASPYFTDLPNHEFKATENPIPNTVPIDRRSIQPTQPKILCVDDNPINLKILQAYLKKLKHTDISCARNGLEAFEEVESSVIAFDIIFMGNCSATRPASTPHH
jgi:hypothetical protein